MWRNASIWMGERITYGIKAAKINVLTTTLHRSTAGSGTTAQKKVLRATHPASKTSKTEIRHTRGGSRRSSSTNPPDPALPIIHETPQPLITQYPTPHRE